MQKLFFLIYCGLLANPVFSQDSTALEKITSRFIEEYKTDAAGTETSYFERLINAGNRVFYPVNPHLIQALRELGAQKTLDSAVSFILKKASWLAVSAGIKEEDKAGWLSTYGENLSYYNNNLCGCLGKKTSFELFNKKLEDCLLKITQDPEQSRRSKELAAAIAPADQAVFGNITNQFTYLNCAAVRSFLDALIAVEAGDRYIALVKETQLKILKNVITWQIEGNTDSVKKYFPGFSQSSITLNKIRTRLKDNETYMQQPPVSLLRNESRMVTHYFSKRISATKPARLSGEVTCITTGVFPDILIKSISFREPEAVKNRKWLEKQANETRDEPPPPMFTPGGSE